jgi:hypothetical protein
MAWVLPHGFWGGRPAIAKLRPPIRLVRQRQYRAGPEAWAAEIHDGLVACRVQDTRFQRLVISVQSTRVEGPVVNQKQTRIFLGKIQKSSLSSVSGLYRLLDKVVKCMTKYFK